MARGESTVRAPVRTNTPHMAPILDPVKAVVMQASVADVETVMVEGRVVKSNGRLLAKDQPELTLRLQRAAERISSSVTEQALQDAYAYVRTAFPLDAASACAARLAGWALQVPGLDKFVFNKMLKQSDAARNSHCAKQG